MKYFLLAVISLFFCDLSAQITTRYTFGTVYFLNGDVYDCQIGFPLLNRSNKLGPTLRSKNKLVVKSLGGDKEKIDNEEIDYIIFEGDQGQFILKWTQGYTVRGRKYDKKKLQKHKSWFLVEGGCEDIISFAWADKFELNKKGQIYANYIGSHGFYGSYSLMKKDEEFPTLICSMTEGSGIGFKKMRKKVFEFYFKGDSHAEQFLEGKKKLTVEEIMNYVKSRCGN